MPCPTMARGLLGIFQRGAGPPATDLNTTTPPVQLPTSSSLRAILADGAVGRCARAGTSGRKGPREEGGRRGGEVGCNREAVGRPRGEAETGSKMTTSQGRKTEKTERGRRGQDGQVSSDGDRGERHERDGLGESNDASEGWRGGSAEDSAKSETEENWMTAKRQRIAETR